MVRLELVLRLLAERRGAAADQPDGFQAVLLGQRRHDERDDERRDEAQLSDSVALDRGEVGFELEAPDYVGDVA